MRGPAEEKDHAANQPVNPGNKGTSILYFN